MAFVITRRCRDCVDGACAEVCPTGCIVQHRPTNGPSDLPNQLFIDPDECIDCRLCEPECPWEAIFDEDSVPPEFHEDIALNAVTRERPQEFDVPVERLGRPVTPQAVEANKRAWAPASGAFSKE